MPAYLEERAEEDPACILFRDFPDIFRVSCLNGRTASRISFAVGVISSGVVIVPIKIPFLPIGLLPWLDGPIQLRLRSMRKAFAASKSELSRRVIKVINTM